MTTAICITGPVTEVVVTESTELVTLVDQIRQEHAAVLDGMMSSLAAAIRCGEHLQAAKKIVGHGGWMKWLSKNFKLSDRTAAAYIRCHKNRERLMAKGTRKQLSFREALSSLATKRPTPATTEDVSGTSQSATAGFEGAEPVTIAEPIQKSLAFPPIRYTMTATILLEPTSDPKKLEDLLLSGQLSVTIKNKTGGSFGGVKVEAIKSMDRIEEGASHVAA